MRMSDQRVETGGIGDGAVTCTQQECHRLVALLKARKACGTWANLAGGGVIIDPQSQVRLN